MRRALAVTVFVLTLAVCLLPAATPAAEPATFDYRGVIEGFYGPPWPKSERLDLMTWMADHGMNLYIHAPKNDPYQRLQWRDPYPAAEMEQYAREIAVAAPRGLKWVPSISPGYPLIEAAQEHDEDICFSCEEDRAVLFSKLDAFYDIGVRDFMISYDDVIKISSHPEDAATYGEGDYSYGVMNADLLNRVYERYAERDPNVTVFTVPADYFGTTTTPYLEGFRATLRDEIVAMWTGVAVVSPTITCTEAEGFGQALGRKPLLWDNYPVNDYAPDKLLIGPYAGRAPDLPECLSGIVSNPALQVRANRIPLATIADYLNDPADYDPERSWRASLEEFAPAGQLRMLRHFVDNVRSSPLDRTEAVRFSRLRDRFLEALDTPRWRDDYRRLRGELRAERDLPGRMRREFRDQGFVRDIEQAYTRGGEGGYTPAGSWLKRLGFNARNGLETSRYVARTRPIVYGGIRRGVLAGRVVTPYDRARTDAALSEVRGMRERDDGNPTNVHGDRFYNALGPTYAEENRMDDYFDAAAQRLAAYAPTADRAASEVSLTVNGEPVQLREDSSYRLPFSGRRAVIVVTDGAGQRTRIVRRR